MTAAQRDLVTRRTDDSVAHLDVWQVGQVIDRDTQRFDGAVVQSYDTLMVPVDESIGTHLVGGQEELCR